MLKWGTLITTILGALLAGFQPQVQEVVSNNKEIASVIGAVLAVVLAQLQPLLTKKDGE